MPSTAVQAGGVLVPAGRGSGGGTGIEKIQHWTGNKQRKWVGRDVERGGMKKYGSKG